MAQAVALLLAALLSGGQAPSPVLHWYRGNLHTHTLASDGDTPPEDVARWYQQHGYAFLVITDHNKITSVSVPGLVLVPGEEVTDRLPKKPLHVNAIGITKVVDPQHGENAVDVMQRNIDAVREAGGIALINHPNFGWAFGSDELKQMRNATLLEIMSGHPGVNSYGGGGVKSHEQMWDDVLTSGRVIYGAAVDDSHYLTKNEDRDAPKPGYAWVVVRTDEATPEKIVAALSSGSFYSSTGVELADYEVNPQTIKVTIVEKPFVKYRVEFVGAGGRILATSIANPAVYTMRGEERYVRARVFDSNGRMAWTQPVFRK